MPPGRSPHRTALALLRAGKTSWFFLTADDAFGHALEADAAAVVREQNGRIIGNVRKPTSAPEFSSILLQAQASRAQVIALANAVGDTVNSVKQASEVGITAGGQTIVARLQRYGS